MLRNLTSAFVTVVTLLVAIIMIFFLLRAMPGDPARIRVQERGGASATALQQTREQLGLNQTNLEQFQKWTLGALQGNFGKSFRTDRPVLDEIMRRLPWSATIGILGLLFACVGGFWLGFWAADKPRGIASATSRTIAISSQALPSFAFATVLIWLLAGELHLIKPFSGSLLERLVLPTLIVTLFSLATIARVAVRAFEDVKTSPYYTTALMKGFSRRDALLNQGWKYALLAVLAVVTPELGWAIGGTTIVEVVFGVPGLSVMVLEGISKRDYPTLQGFLVVVAVWMVGARLLIGLAQRRLDPRPFDVG